MRILLLLIGIALGTGATLLLHTIRDAPPESVPALDDDDDGDGQREAPRRIRQAGGVNVVVLDAEARALAGIETERPRPVVMADEAHTFGQVIDPAELLDGLSLLRAAEAAVRAQQAITGAVRERRDTLREWSARGEISVAKELSELEVQVRRELDVSKAREAEVERLRAGLVTRWGPALLTSATLRADWLTALAAGTARLIAFAAAAAPASLVAAPDERRDRATAVRVLGAAPAVLGSVQRATYYGVVEHPGLRIGMRLNCWIPRAAAPRAGLLVPHSAILWHGGERWFFTEVSSNSFARRALGEALTHSDGLLLTQGLVTDSMVVVRGAQALLAEEFRASIPAEDDD